MTHRRTAEAGSERKTFPPFLLPAVLTDDEKGIKRVGGGHTVHSAQVLAISCLGWCTVFLFFFSLTVISWLIEEIKGSQERAQQLITPVAPTGQDRFLWTVPTPAGGNVSLRGYCHHAEVFNTGILDGIYEIYKYS